MKSHGKYPEGVIDVGHMYTDMISVYICISWIDLTGFLIAVINTSHKLPHTMKSLHRELSAKIKLHHSYCNPDGRISASSTSFVMQFPPGTL